MISRWNSSKTVSFPYLLSCLDNFINVNALKTSTPLTPQDALCEQRNWSVQFEELAERINPTVSVLQSDDQRDRTSREKSKNSRKVVSREMVCFQSDEQRDRTSREKSENSRKVVSREMVCFKIMKLVYNNSIYTKIKSHYF